MAWITNLPTDTELLDALERLMERSRGRGKRVTFSSLPCRSVFQYRVGNGSREVSVRIALRAYLQRHKALPPDRFGDPLMQQR